KRGVVLDLGNNRGRAVAEKLIKWADVLIDNHSPRVLENFGLHWENLHQINPALIVCQISAFGQTGPHRHSIAFGSSIEGYCGLAAGMRYHNTSTPLRTNSFYPDPVTGCHATIAVL